MSSDISESPKWNAPGWKEAWEYLGSAENCTQCLWSLVALPLLSDYVSPENEEQRIGLARSLAREEGMAEVAFGLTILPTMDQEKFDSFKSFKRKVYCLASVRFAQLGIETVSEKVGDWLGNFLAPRVHRLFFPESTRKISEMEPSESESSESTIPPRDVLSLLEDLD